MLSTCLSGRVSVLRLKDNGRRRLSRLQFASRAVTFYQVGSVNLIKFGLLLPFTLNSRDTVADP